MIKWTRNEIKEAIQIHGSKHNTKQISRNKKKAILLQKEIEKFRNVSITDIIRFLEHMQQTYIAQNNETNTNSMDIDTPNDNTKIASRGFS